MVGVYEFKCNVTIRNVVAHGQGSSPVAGHPERWLDGITFDNVRLTLATDPNAPFDAATNAINFRYARNLKLQNVNVTWEKPLLKNWQSALTFESVDGLELNGFTGRQAWPESDAPAVKFLNVTNARLTRATAPEGTGIFLHAGPGSRAVWVEGNDFRKARVPWKIDPIVPTTSVTVRNNQFPK